MTNDKTTALRAIVEQYALAYGETINVIAAREAQADAVKYKEAVELMYASIGRDFGHLEPLAAANAWMDAVLDKEEATKLTVKLSDARALVEEMYDYITNDECTQYLPEKLLTKARAFMEGKV